MIEIIVNGTSLDLDPECSFEIEMEQPMFNADHTPVPYSTSISFMPSAKNCGVFGYLPAMLWEPRVKRMQAEIFAGGILLLSGCLVYEGCDDGKISYNFAAKSVNDILSNDISALLGDLSVGNGQTGIQEAKSAQGGNGEIVAAPPFINKEAVTDIIYESYPAGDAEPVGISVRYHNWPFAFNQIFTPAISAQSLIQRSLGRSITIDNDIEKTLKHLYIIGLYKPDATSYITGFANASIPIKDTLPVMTQSDLLRNVLRMFGAFVFIDGKEYVMRTGSSILENGKILDWDSKIADKASIAIEKAQGYSLGYSNESDDTYDASNLKEDISDGDILTAGTMSEVLGSFNEEDYTAVMHERTGDVFSGKEQVINKQGLSIEYLIDNTRHNIPSVKSEDGFDSIFDSNIEFELVRCVPDKLYDSYVKGNSEVMAPIIEPAAIGEERGSKIYAGLIIEGQMCDKGIVMTRDNVPIDDPVFVEKDYNMSLAPESLYDRHHKIFAQWLAKDRQTVTVDLSLSPLEISAFRMYHKVYFRGRQWLVKKLSITFAVRSDIPEVRGEFVAV